MKPWTKLYSLGFAALLGAFSLYALLDTFVIRRVYATVETPTAPETVVSAAKPALLSGGTVTDRPIATADSYQDGSVTITLRRERAWDTDIYVADITVKDASALRTAFARNSYGRNVTAAASVTAEQVNAILAVNGDNYGSREKGYVIRNGVLYRDTAAKNQEDLVIWSDGSFSIIKESEITASELLSQGAVQVFSFGPGLLENGQITVSQTDEVDRAMASNPRTAIGILGPGHYVLVVSDGRTAESRGLSLYELAEFLQELGVETAYNLDGGGSSTMVFQGNVVNNPTGGRRSGSERAVTDIVYIG